MEVEGSGLCQSDFIEVSNLYSFIIRRNIGTNLTMTSLQRSIMAFKATHLEWIVFVELEKSEYPLV